MRPLRLYLLCLLSGVAALSWELLWQHFASLAIGVSATGTAITLATTMAAMTAGSLGMAKWLRGHPTQRPLRLYGLLEGVVGLSGLLLMPAFDALAVIDAATFAHTPALAPVVQLLGIAVIVGPAAAAMGATIPVLGLIARSGVSLSSLYAFNTAGAAAGTLTMAFFVIPSVGISSAVHLAAMVNLLVCLVGWVWRPEVPAWSQPPQAEPVSETGAVKTWSLTAVMVTGFATFALEVAWFRALKASLFSTTDTFAVILVAVLLPLAFGARAAGRLQKLGVSVASALVGAGLLVLLATPAIERFHHLAALTSFQSVWGRVAFRLGLSLAIMGPPMLLLGVPLPTLLEEARTPTRWGRLYAFNTIGAVLGSLGAAWVLLPTVGVARSAWLAGLLLIVAGCWQLVGRRRLQAALGATVALAIAVFSRTSVGQDRVQSRRYREPIPVVAFREGPDSTVAIVKPPDGSRRLLIDGFGASGEVDGAQYMEWMGRLPMLLHPAPHRALVICFGTGQTANAVREEGPDWLDVVELNANVLDLAPNFRSNHDVLHDPRVHPHVMDGRAWLRRTTSRYDAITLEPMPPHFAGVNSLYSEEFYRLAADRLNPGGLVAQWLPFHLVAVEEATSIATTFQQVFPDAILWIDPRSRTGILVGRKAGAERPLGEEWPGFNRNVPARTLDAAAVAAAVKLTPATLRKFSDFGVVIDDDNQYLSYGWWQRGDVVESMSNEEASLQLVERVRRP